MSSIFTTHRNRRHINELHRALKIIYAKSVYLSDKETNHVCSSQAFAFNLLFHLCIDRTEALTRYFSSLLGADLKELTRFQFEFEPDENLLGEWPRDDEKPDKYVTAADCALFFTTSDCRQAIVLVEVKFTEAGFTECNGADSPRMSAADRVMICENRSNLFTQPDRCYYSRKAHALTNSGGYFQHFGNLHSAFPGNEEITTCPFRKLHQCMRNHALARSLRTGDTVSTWFGLVHHDRNEEIAAQWVEYTDLCSDRLQRDLFKAPASALAMVSDDDSYRRFMRERYRIG